jgi:hypothetical protein
MSKRPWHLDRRQLLRGAGATLALPLLEGMTGSRAEATPRPKRLVVTYISYGTYMPNGPSGITDLDEPHHDWSWWPCRDPGPLTFNESSKPFAPLQDRLSYLQGLDHAGGHSLGGHSSGDVFATGADMADRQKTNSISIDQVAANAHGDQTRYASLVLGTEGGTGSYGQAKTLSHRGPGKPIPALHKPREIFDRMFRPYAGRDLRDVRRELQTRRSVLDLVLEQSKALDRRLGRADQQKMDEYLESVRDAEKRIERVDRWTHTPMPEVDASGLRLDVTPKEPEDYVRCMYDLLFLALQTDLTRCATFMTESEQSTAHEVGNYSNYLLGYKGNTHDISHKRPEGISGMWDQWRARQHAYFLDKLRAAKEGGGDMLDHTVVLWGSAHPHQAHNTQNYPIQLAGGDALGFQHGKLHRFVGADKVPLANLFVSMLRAVDVPAERFADSTGTMTALREEA